MPEGIGVEEDVSVVAKKKELSMMGKKKEDLV